MDDDQYSLSNLRDIVIPEAPPLWPPAAGMWVALGIIVLLMLLVAWKLYTMRRRNAYRKAGLLLLSEVKTAHDVSVVLKRVALAAFPREHVASLYGDDWAAFLQTTCAHTSFLQLTATDANPDPELIRLAGTWIRHHRVPEHHAPVTAS